METVAHPPNRLSNAQLMLLNLFSRDLPEETLLEIRDLLSKFLFEKAQQEADRLIAEGKLSLEDLDKASDEIIEHRGNYLKKIRGDSGH